MAWEAKQNRNCHRKWNRFVCLFSSCFFLARLGFSWFDHINVNMRERASMRWLKRFVAHKTPSTNADGIANGAAIKKKLHHFNYVCVCARLSLSSILRVRCNFIRCNHVFCFFCGSVFKALRFDCIEMPSFWPAFRISHETDPESIESHERTKQRPNEWTNNGMEYEQQKCKLAFSIWVPLCESFRYSKIIPFIVILHFCHFRSAKFSLHWAGCLFSSHIFIICINIRTQQRKKCKTFVPIINFMTCHHKSGYYFAFAETILARLLRIHNDN